MKVAVCIVRALRNWEDSLGSKCVPDRGMQDSAGAFLESSKRFLNEGPNLAKLDNLAPVVTAKFQSQARTRTGQGRGGPDPGFVGRTRRGTRSAGCAVGGAAGSKLFGESIQSTARPIANQCLPFVQVKLEIGCVWWWPPNCGPHTFLALIRGERETAVCQNNKSQNVSPKTRHRQRRNSAGHRQNGDPEPNQKKGSPALRATTNFDLRRDERRKNEGRKKKRENGSGRQTK